MLVNGRGTGLTIAQEAALKFEESCAIQAEVFSSAAVQHGPMAPLEAIARARGRDPDRPPRLNKATGTV